MHIATRELFFSRTLEPTKAKKRYRALVAILHPDVETGDTRLMALLNNEYDAFQAGTLQPAQPESQSASPPPRESYDAMVQRAGDHLISHLPSYLRINIIFTVSVVTHRVVARGQATYQYREDLKALGFRWDIADRVWFCEVVL